MGSKHLKLTLVLLAAVLWTNFATAQTTKPYLKEVLILNGGQYGNPQEDITLIGYNPILSTTRISDTIHSQSIQDLLIEGDFAYIAAEDSLVKIRLSDFSQVAKAGFPGASTYTMALYQNQLLVGNWYGQADSNLYVFDKTDLTLDYVVPQIERGVKGIVIVGDTAYLSQNYDDVNFSDSAGYLAKVHLPTGTFAGTALGDNVSDIGRLFYFKDAVLGVGGATDVVTLYTPSNGNLQQSPIPADVQGGYGTLLQIVDDTLFGVFNDKIASFNLFNLTFIDTSIVDTLVTAFAYDTISGNFYVSQTDYTTYTRGIVFDRTGSAIDTFLVGYAPEAIKLLYEVTVGVNEVATQQVSVYPNPVNYLLSIRHTGSSAQTMMIRDLTGRTLQTITVEAGMLTTMDVSTLAPGLYLLQSADGRFTQKVVKQ